MLVAPPKVDVNARRLPSGDQTEKPLNPDLNVKGEAVPCFRSYIQMLENPVCGSRTVAATEFPSGEIVGVRKCAGAPTTLTCLPDRSTHVSCEVPTESAGTYATMP